MNVSRIVNGFLAIRIANPTFSLSVVENFPPRCWELKEGEEDGLNVVLSSAVTRAAVVARTATGMAASVFSKKKWN